MAIRSSVTVARNTIVFFTTEARGTEAMHNHVLRCSKFVENL